MKGFNSFVLDFSVSILDRIYESRPIQRFWVLEVIARAPYFVKYLYLNSELRNYERY